MSAKNFLGLMALSGVMLFANACKKKTEEQVPQVVTDYDKVLMDALVAATGENGSELFMLPASDDYSNIPQDPTNPLSAEKVALGQLLFHETGLARDASMDGDGEGTYSCSSCHHAWAGFQANKQQGIGDGGIGFGVAGEGRVFNPDYALDSIDLQPLRTPTAMNGAYQQVMLWNGQFGATGPNEGTDDIWPPGTPIWNNHFGHEGLETQAIAGLTVHRMVVDEDVCNDYTEYEGMFDDAFPEWPEENRYTERTAGLAIGAYERTLLSNLAPFQLWLSGDTEAMTDKGKRGGAVFFGKGNCYSCHNGPALNSMSFHALGMNDMEGNGTYGAHPNLTANLGRGSFTGDTDDDYKFKTPQLYNLKDSPFFGHGGTFTSLRDVVEYKNAGIPENGNVPGSQLADEFVPLGLTADEIDDLVYFLENELYDPDLLRYVPEELPSGNCFPNNDPQSVIDQGCVQ